MQRTRAKAAAAAATTTVTPLCKKKKKRKVGSSVHWRPEHAARPAAARGVEWAALEGGCVGGGSRSQFSSRHVASPTCPLYSSLIYFSLKIDKFVFTFSNAQRDVCM